MEANVVYSINLSKNKAKELQSADTKDAIHCAFSKIKLFGSFSLSRTKATELWCENSS